MVSMHGLLWGVCEPGGHLGRQGFPRHSLIVLSLAGGSPCAKSIRIVIIIPIAEMKNLSPREFI